MMLPYMVTIIPTYILFSRLHLINLIGSGSSGDCPAVPSYLPLPPVLCRIPKELEEAATLDGCTWFQTFYRVFLPMSGPVVAVVAILVFQWAWSDFITPDHVSDR